MKIVHLSDLHLGKRVNEFSMIEDQKYILKEISNIITEQKPDAVIIAGDVYDKSVPPVEAVTLFDDFITNLRNKKIPVLIISGNHDSAERMSFGNKIMKSSGVYITSAFNGIIEPVVLTDEYGPVNFYLLPFIKPIYVRDAFQNDKNINIDEIKTYTEAMAAVIKSMNINKSQRNVLVAHQFVTGGARCDSEEISVGGTDNIDASVFSDFDYVALGHLHGPQNIGSEKVCYCGTPLKYSFSEVNHTKSVKIVDLREKKDGITKTVHDKIILKPLHDMRIIKGSYNDLMLKSNYENTNVEDYIQAIITDEDPIYNCFRRLQGVYKNIMKMDYENERTKNRNHSVSAINTENYSPLELFQIFYKERNKREMTEEQTKYISNLIENIWEDQ